MKTDIKTTAQYDMLAAMNDNDLVTYCLGGNPDCTYGEVRNGLTAFFRVTRVVVLWRNEECYLEGDPPRRTVEGFPA